MKIRDALSLIDLRLPSGDLAARQLAACHSIEDLERLARRRLPRSVLDYVNGGADHELSLAQNTDAIHRWSFTPQVLTDVAQTSTATSILGHPAAAPFGFAPTGYTRMISPLGEKAVAAAAGRAGIPYALSTMATTSLEDLAAHDAGRTDLWFQLYIWRDRRLTQQLIARASDSGYRVLEVAVDTAVSGLRLRDARNGFTIPPKLTLASVLDIGTKPKYWTGMLRSPSMEFANVSAADGPDGGYTIENITKQFDPSVQWSDLEDIRSRWDGKLVLKGPIGPADALRAADLGVDALHLSNHGGRQLDRSIAPINLVAPVRQAVGDDLGIVVDSGFRHGADIATAIALGADAAFVGRPYLWGLVAGGHAGLDTTARLFTDGLRRTMQLLGVRDVAELRRRGPELLSTHEARTDLFSDTPYTSVEETL
ncbi:L-lactate dehydrogenase (cytochrome) [Pseudoclavibacter sp. JAI123]|uniref:alpha-hydroxy acid oxidase n=1 Tax=Pseudoclavibacter sp. JAI123 TaxID=2723065 RepID=UPI0015CE261E|nr:alpha-hydroxy acid oxidase [Pseudoclavibacter sp. JAI123]NYF14304.1 L-lactate dehydrogenase (cytochrome) [Pseudoclavibacter sp. JAI123]